MAESRSEEPGRTAGAARRNRRGRIAPRMLLNRLWVPDTPSPTFPAPGACIASLPRKSFVSRAATCALSCWKYTPAVTSTGADSMGCGGGVRFGCDFNRFFIRSLWPEAKNRPGLDCILTRRLVNCNHRKPTQDRTGSWLRATGRASRSSRTRPQFHVAWLTRPSANSNGAQFDFRPKRRCGLQPHGTHSHLQHMTSTVLDDGESVAIDASEPSQPHLPRDPACRVYCMRANSRHSGSSNARPSRCAGSCSRAHLARRPHGRERVCGRKLHVER